MLPVKIIKGKKCWIRYSGESDAILIQAVHERDLDALDSEVEIIKRLAPDSRFTLAAFLVEDWNGELSPWASPAVFGNENFGSGAEKTLSFVIESLIPHLESLTGKKRFFLGGYSLAGLFALWAAYQTDIFYGIVAASPSVWFPGWIEYIESRAIKSPNVYLSLGDKEEKTRNKTMSAVGDNIRRQYELLRQNDFVKCAALEWNPGNHFAEPEKRTAKGFAFLLNV